MATEAVSLGIEEYRALRATIRERGTARHFVSLITFSVWAATMLWVASSFVVPLFALAPLAVLVAGFEIGLALHVGVERIGRYLQVKFESGADVRRGWETTASTIDVPSGGIDPLFLKLYIAFAVLNLLLGVWVSAAVEFAGETSPLSPVVVFFALAHVAAVVRWLAAARFAKGQRAREQAAFEKLLKS